MRSRPLALVLVLACSGCIGTGNAAAPPANQAVASAQRLDTAQRYRLALPVATRYVNALAHGDSNQAQTYVGTSGFAQLSSLNAFETWFSDIPVEQLRLKATPLSVPDRSAVAVRMVLEAQLGPAPPTAWVKLGERVLLVQDQREGWRVVADITGRRAFHETVYGLSLMVQPHFLSTAKLSVVYGPTDAEQAAQAILHSGEPVVKMLHSKYGGGAASRHPLIYLVAALHQGELLAGVKIGRAETPAGWQVGDFAYIDYPVWLGYDIVEQDSTIAHELTHVASHTLLSGAPHSLLEGVAMYEEERYLNSLGYQRSFALISAEYAHGWPSATVWGLRYDDWGIRNGVLIEAAYEDGEAMTAVIMRQHGGVPAVARLARGFRALHRIRYTPAQVESVFAQALGVPFSTVVAQAHAYAAART